MKKIVTIIILLSVYAVYAQQSRNYNGDVLPYSSASTVYLGDVVTFKCDAWDYTNGHLGSPRAYIHTSSDINNGSFGDWGSNSFGTMTVISPRFTSTGTWYWGILVSYSNDPSKYYCRNSQAYYDMWTIPTSDITISISALNNPFGQTAVVDATNPNTQINLTWSKDGQNHNVMIVRKISTDSWTEPTQGTTYSVSSSIGAGTVVYNSSGTSYSNTGLSESSNYDYKFYSENYSYYSSGVTSSESTLPVELTSFSASVKNKSVNLVWHTATEVNNYGFEIEKRQSSIANSHWSKVGFVHGNGNSNSANEYSYTDKTVTSGKYIYRLKQIDNDGKYEYSKEVEIDLGKPTTFALNQNYPNPFNPSTSIQYSVVGSQYVSLKVFNVLGKEVAVLVNEKQEPGTYTVDFTSANLSGGAYFYRLQAGEFVQTKKMILLK